MSEIDPIEPAAPPDRATELTDSALDWLQSTFARKVALYLTPVLLPVLGALSYWLEDAVGIDMNPAVAAAFVVAVVIGSGGALIAFVYNHGQGASQLGQAALELEKLYEAGRGELDRQSAGNATIYYGPPLEPTFPPEETGARPESPEA